MLEHITIDLPVSEAQFLEAYSKERGITVSEAIERLVVFLERTQHLKPNEKILSLVGSLNEPASMWDYLNSKYQ